MAGRKRWVAALNYFMLLIFLLAVIVQYNDVDAALWMLAYGLAALACVLWRWTTVSRFWYVLIGGISLVWALYLLFTYGDQLTLDGMFSSVQMKSKSVEVIREAGGLFIITIWMTVLSLHTYRHSE